MKLAVNGVTYRVRMAGEGPPLLMLHGFTGTGLTWERLMPALSQRFQTIAPDLLGHGETDAPADAGRYRMERCVDDLLALLAALGHERCHLLGYSMGGRVAMHVALAAPERVMTLVLEGASPGIANPLDRILRARQDELLAASIERDGVQAFVERWEQLPLFGTQSRLAPEVQAAVRAQRLKHSAVGLANSLRGMGTGAQEPLVDQLGSLTMPCFLIAGELDEKYRGIVAAMAGRIPHAETAVVPGAGHNVHLEKPDAFLEKVLAFWDKHVPSAGPDRARTGQR